MISTLALAIVLQQPSPEDRARSLVAKMTLTEKIGQLMMDAPAIPRLNVPAYHWWNEALHGVARNGVATVFPQAIGLAATWDTELMYQVATATSIEARAKNNQNPRGIYHGLTLWSPNVNIFRDPRWGRGHETYGEDPVLTGRMGVAFVRGIQGDDPNILRAVATPKHFAVHSGPEPLRHEFDAKTPERDLFETYLPAFEATVREGKATSVMSAYSGFNGVPATGNPWLLTRLLRDTWGFSGAVVSDVDSVYDLYTGHKIVPTAAEASAMALKAGNDLCSGTTYRALPEAVRKGLVTEIDIDRAMVRLFTLRYRLGMFDKVPYQQIPPSEIDSPAHNALSRLAAQRSLVLLKNDGTLPLAPAKLKRVAVIGPVADDKSTLLGNYNGDPSNPITILSGIRRKLEPKGITVEAAPGCALAAGLDKARPLPPGTMFTDASRQTAGFQREVFVGTQLDGTPISRSIDTKIDFQWNPTSGPDILGKGIPTTNVSIRWTGVFIPTRTEAIQLNVSADDGMRLYVDDKLVVDDWRDGAERSKTAALNVTQGKPVKIRLEFYQAAQGAAIRFGWNGGSGPDPRQNEAVALAERSDVVILTLGITPDLEGEEMSVNAEGFKGGDRTTIELPKPQRELLARLKKTGKPIVLVLTGGSALSFDAGLPNAALLQWYSGGSGGEAVADALVGEISPAGRLPVTFYRSEKDLPPFENYAMAGRTYRYFGGKPLFPFGFGLSYTKFNYGSPVLKTQGDSLDLQVPVRNIGTRNSDEVVQVYARFDKPVAGDAKRWLVGFQRLPLNAGETKTVVLSIPKSRLRVWDPEKRAYVVRPGKYHLEVGTSSADIRRSLVWTN